MGTLTDYLLTRRSSLSLSLHEPGPNAQQLEKLITIASRVPDHGKLAPWRFVLWTKEARATMHADLLNLLENYAEVDDKPKKIKGTDKLLHAPCVLAVISTASDHPKIPVREQVLSAGAACMNCIIASNALGFEAQWLTAWYVYDDQARDILDLKPGEEIAGIIHIGTSSTPKTERARPDLDEIYSVRER